MAGKRDIEAGRAFIRLSLKNSLTGALSRALKNMGAQLTQVGARVSQVGAGISAAGGAILAPFAQAVRTFADVGDKLDKMSQRTGVSASALAELGFAAEQSGTDMDKVENAIRRMQKTIGDANRGLSTAVDGLDNLGLSAQQLNGMAPEDQFDLIARRLREIKDPTQQAAAAMDVFGSRTGTALLPMLNDLEKLKQEARDLGLVPADEEVKKAAAVTDAINRIKRSFGAVLFTVGAQFADVVLAAAEAVKNVVVQVQEWVKNNKGLLMTIAGVGAALVIAGGALTAIGGTIIFVGFALTALGTILGALTSPLALIVAAIAGGVTAWAMFTESGQKTMGVLQRVFGDIFKTAKDTFGGIGDALRAGNLELAAEIAFTGLQLAALQALGAIRELFGDTVANVIGQLASGDLQGAWDTMTAGLAAAWDSLMQGIISAMASAADALIDLWAQTTKTILKGLVGNSVFERLLGLDKQREEYDRLEAKRRELAKKLGIEFKPDKSFDDQLTADIDQIVNSKATNAKEAVAGLESAAADMARASQKKIDSRNREVGNSFSKAAEELQQRLEMLTAKAAKEAGATVSERDKGGGEAQAPGLRGAAGGIGVTFNAAAAIAAGFQGASPQQKMIDHLGAIETLTKDVVEAGKRTFEAVNKLYSSFVYGGS